MIRREQREISGNKLDDIDLIDPTRCVFLFKVYTKYNKYSIIYTCE